MSQRLRLFASRCWTFRSRSSTCWRRCRLQRPSVSALESWGPGDGWADGKSGSTWGWWWWNGLDFFNGGWCFYSGWWGVFRLFEHDGFEDVEGSNITWNTGWILETKGLDMAHMPSRRWEGFLIEKKWKALKGFPCFTCFTPQDTETLEWILWYTCQPSNHIGSTFQPSTGFLCQPFSFHGKLPISAPRYAMKCFQLEERAPGAPCLQLRTPRNHGGYRGWSHIIIWDHII